MLKVVEALDRFDRVPELIRDQRIGQVCVCAPAGESRDAGMEASLDAPYRSGELDVTLLRSGREDLKALRGESMRNRRHIRLGRTEALRKLAGRQPMPKLRRCGI